MKRFKMKLSEIILLLVVFLVPLIVGYSKLSLTDHEKLLAPSGTFIDLFSFRRGMVLTLLSFAAGISVILDCWLKKESRPSRHFTLGLIVFTAMLFVSSYFAIDHTVAWRGVLDRYEGLYVWISYSILTLLGYLYAKREGYIAVFGLLIKTISGSAIIVGAVGFLQFMDYQVLNSDFVRYLIAPSSVAASTREFFKENGTVFSTLANPNYLGAYMAAATIVALGGYLHSKSKFRYCYLGAAGLSFFNLIVSQSSAGLAGFAVAFPFVVTLLMERPLRDRWAAAIGLLGLLPAVLLNLKNFGFPTESYWILVLSGILTGAVLVLVKKRVWIRAYVLWMVLALSFAAVPAGFYLYANLTDLPPQYLHEASISQNALDFEWDSGKLSVMLKEDNALAFLSDGMSIDSQMETVSQNSRIYNLSDPRFSWASFEVQQFEQFDVLKVEPQGALFFIYDQSFLWVGTNKEQAEIQSTDYFGLKGFERLGSGRGYIWSRSMQLLPYSLLTGVGPDNFAFQFPQYDLEGKVNMGGANLYIDKPHNSYLKIWIEIGAIGFAAFMYLLIMGLLPLRNYIAGRIPGELMILPIALLCFAVSSFFNDTMACLTPIMMVLMGMCFELQDEQRLKAS